MPQRRSLVKLLCSFFFFFFLGGGRSSQEGGRGGLPPGRVRGSPRRCRSCPCTPLERAGGCRIGVTFGGLVPRPSSRCPGLLRPSCRRQAACPGCRWRPACHRRRRRACASAAGGPANLGPAVGCVAPTRREGSARRRADARGTHARLLGGVRVAGPGASEDRAAKVGREGPACALARGARETFQLVHRNKQNIKIFLTG